jgi:hypothetical protein
MKTMKKLPITLLAAAMLAFVPALQAKDKPEKTKGKPEVAETATKEVKEAGESKKEAAKNLTRDEHTKRNAAIEKADADSAVADLKAKDEAADKKLKALKRSKEAKPEEIIAADKASDEAHAAYISARRSAIAKADPEAAKLDERVFANTERMRKAKEAKEKDAGDAVEGAKGKGKGLEKAPGQLKKTEGGEATDFAPGRTKEKGKKKDKEKESGE